ncbi:MAG: hypothetical protein HQ522_04605 [Bacteroidetes bacterium]|nr:hypothetical protein [Bacteroidota bacterium]
MKTILFAIVFFMATNVNSQEKYLSITNSESGKVSVFKENKRIRVKTINGGKLSGKLKIMDNDEVMIKNVIVPITSIARIKNNPLVLNVLVSGSLFIIGGYGVIGGLVVIAWSGSAIGAIPILIGAGSFAAGILSPNFLPATNIYKNTNIKVVDLIE